MKLPPHFRVVPIPPRGVNTGGSWPVFQLQLPVPGNEHNTALLPCSCRSPSPLLPVPRTRDPALLARSQHLGPRLGAAISGVMKAPRKRTLVLPEVRPCSTEVGTLPLPGQAGAGTPRMARAGDPAPGSWGGRELGSRSPPTLQGHGLGEALLGCSSPAEIEHPCPGGTRPRGSPERPVLVPEGCLPGAAGSCPEPEPVPPLPLSRLEPWELSPAWGAAWSRKAACAE